MMTYLRQTTHLTKPLQMILLLLMLAACQTMPHGAQQALPRQDQQRLDRLLTLMDQRLEVAAMVAQTKWNSGAPIDDPVREGKILESMSGALADVDQAFARRFFQAQFDAGKIIQRALHAQWRSQAHASFVSPPDLVRDIRPALDRITPSLIDALRQAGPLLQQEPARRYIQRRAMELIRGDVNGTAREEALRPLLH